MSASMITSYVSKVSHPLSSGLLFAGANSLYETETISFDKELAKDFVLQAVSSYGGEMLSPTLSDFLPMLPPILTQALSTALLNTAAGYASDKVLSRNVKFDSKDAMYRFVISLGAEAVTSAVLDNGLGLIGSLNDGRPAITASQQSPSAGRPVVGVRY